MPDQPKVPTCITGVIAKLDKSAVDNCMDGATHQIKDDLTKLNPRLKPYNAQIKNLLNNAADTGGTHTVCGYYFCGTEGADCDYILVYSVDILDDFEKRLEEIIL